MGGQYGLLGRRHSGKGSAVPVSCPLIPNILVALRPERGTRRCSVSGWRRRGDVLFEAPPPIPAIACTSWPTLDSSVGGSTAKPPR